MFGNTNSYPLACPKPIVHIDCDAFFASVEQALCPDLKGKAVVIGKERGIAMAASYEAKTQGITYPMPLFKAKKIIKDLICLPSDYETYSLFSKRMLSIIREFTSEVEEFSIDEAFVDLSGAPGCGDEAGCERTARRMKEEIQAQLGLTVSVGLSFSKTLAKIASRHRKPNGFTVISLKELPVFLRGVPLQRVCGFGPSSVMKLQRLGICNVWEYAQKPEAWARKVLGKIGVELLLELQGKAIYGITKEEKTDYGSIGKTKKFTPASSDREFVRAQLVRNMESAFIKLRRYDLRVKTIAVYLRRQDFTSAGCDGNLERPTSSFQEAFPLVMTLFDRIFAEDTQYRLTGIVLAGLEKDRSEQRGLFESKRQTEKQRAVDAVIDEASLKYGKHQLHTGTGLWLKKYKKNIADRGDLPRRKKERLKGETFRKYLKIPVWNVKV